MKTVVNWESSLVVSYKTKHILTYRPVTCPYIYPKELRTYVHTETCTQMFIDDSLPKRESKQGVLQQVSGQINTAWFIQTTERYLVLKWNQLSSHEKTWKEPKHTLLNKRSQCEKTTHCTIPTLWHSGKGTTMETVQRSVFARSWAEGKMKGAQRVFKAIKLLRYHNDGYMTL